MPTIRSPQRSYLISTASTTLPKTGFLLLAAISLFWGLNWPGMKIIVSEVPVWWFRASCLVFGGVALLVLSATAGNRWRMHTKEIWPIVVCTLFNVCCWQIFSAYGVSLMPAGRASIIAFTMPVWATLFSAWLLNESITYTKVCALLMGLLGLAVLIGPDLLVLKQTPLGPLCMLIAALGWALGTVLFKRGSWDIPVASNIGWQLLIGAVPLSIGAVLLEPFPAISTFSDPVWLALAYVYIFPMTFCQWAYLKVVHLFPAAIAAIGTLMVPVIGIYSSSLLLSEAVGWREFASLVLICSALAMVLVIPNLNRHNTTVNNTENATKGVGT